MTVINLYVGFGFRLLVSRLHLGSWVVFRWWVGLCGLGGVLLLCCGFDCAELVLVLVLLLIAAVRFCCLVVGCYSCLLRFVLGAVLLLFVLIVDFCVYVLYRLWYLGLGLLVDFGFVCFLGSWCGVVVGFWSVVCLCELRFLVFCCVWWAVFVSRLWPLGFVLVCCFWVWVGCGLVGLL